MAQSIVSLAVKRIDGLLFDEANFLLNVPDEVENLQRNLVEMLCLLKDADSRQQEDHAVHNWVSEIRDIAYDAEDIIENYVLKVTSKRDTSFLKTFANYLSPRNCVCIQVHKVGSDIARINSRIPDLTRKMLEHGITRSDPLQPRRRLANNRMEYGHVEEDYVGMEDYVDEVARELVDVNKQHRVVSLWGMGGLGKTSLARKIYMDKRVTEHFKYFAWTCVTQDYQVENILCEILKSLDPKKAKETASSELHESLYKILQEKRCLVILDDIWTTDAWDSLKAALPINNSSSRILITTRNRDIARHMDPHSFICSLRCLTEEEGWELMKRRAFVDTPGLTVGQEREDLGRKIINQCGRLPLAIIVISGVLAYKMEMEEWELVHQNIDLHLQNRNTVDTKNVLKVLELSYNDLPYHMKPCFLYMGSFQEDSWISVKNLVRFWIAEGFVTNHENRLGGSILDVAESYVNELVDRGMVQARVKKLNGRVGYCRLHDLMRDLSIRKAMEENFSINTKMEGSSPVKFSTCKMRRLSMYMKRYPDTRDQQELQRISHLRSLICHLDANIKIPETDYPVDKVFENFRLLRVLDMVANYPQGVIISESIGDLIHLRHFRLDNFRTMKLPSTIGNLVLLETFDIKHFHVRGPSFIPNVLWKMKRLRELCLPPCWISNSKSAEKLRFSCLESLEIFENFSFRVCETEDLQKFINLRKLTIFSEEEEDCEGFEIFSLLNKIKFKNLSHVSFKFYKRNERYAEIKLRDLAVYSGSCKLYLGGHIPCLPNFPPLLKKLTLHKSTLVEDPMPVLEKLPNLLTLELSTDSFIGREMVCSEGGFPKLKSLTLFYLDSLKEIVFLQGTMQCVSLLNIEGCENLKMLPQGLDFISSSGKLDFTYVTNYFETFQVVKEEQGWVYQRGDRISLFSFSYKQMKETLLYYGA